MIYISGKITGNKNYFEQFNAAEYKLVSVYGGVINPCKLEHTNARTWKDYMIRDIQALVECDYIYMLKGWWRSKGARLERKIAKGLGIKVLYEK